MSIILKHIFENIKEKKGRSLLIIISLIVATAVLMLNITLKDEILVKVTETFRTIYGNADIEICSEENFEAEQIDLKNINVKTCEYVGTYGKFTKDEQTTTALFLGINLEEAKSFKLINDIKLSELKENEIIISEKTAEKYKLKKEDIISITAVKDKKQVNVKVVAIASENGILGAETTENVFFICNKQTVTKMNNQSENIITGLYLDITNNEEIDSSKDILEQQNKDFNVVKLVDIDTINEGVQSISSIFLFTFAIVLLMVIYVMGSLSKLIISERIPVIGTFRSVGATKGKMNMILMIENAIYGLIGGTIGSIIGFFATRKISSIFITSNVELSQATTKFNFGIILIGIVFAVLLEVLISLKAIIKNNRKPIKDIIFNTQNTRYKLNKIKVCIGIILIVFSLIINYYNAKTESNFIYGIINVICFMIGVSFAIPAILKLISKIAVTICKKMNLSTALLANKNIANSKTIISSCILIFVALSSILMVYTISISVTKVFTSFKYIYDYDVQVMNLSKPKEEYYYIKDIEGVEDISFDYFTYFDDLTIENKKLTTNPFLLQYDDNYKKAVEIYDYDVKNMKINEVIIDEIYAQKNDIKIGDILVINSEHAKEKQSKFEVVALCNSTMFTTTRNVLVFNEKSYIKYITDIPREVLVHSDMEKTELKEKLKKEIDEIGLEIVTYDEYIGEQEEQAETIMSLIYVIIVLAVGLSLIGVINNQIISFMQRKKEFAMLNSTCMSQGQIKRLVFLEILFSVTIISVISIIATYLLSGIVQTAMRGIYLCIPIEFELLVTLKVIGVIFMVLILTALVPIRRLKKLNIVEEIKYE